MFFPTAFFLASFFFRVGFFVALTFLFVSVFVAVSVVVEAAALKGKEDAKERIQIGELCMRTNSRDMFVCATMARETTGTVARVINVDPLIGVLRNGIIIANIVDA